MKLVSLLVLCSLALCSSAYATNDPPGRDPCSHGATGKQCKPDPQPDRGKDCEKHGRNGGVNEDHCAPAPPPVVTPPGCGTTCPTPPSPQPPGCGTTCPPVVTPPACSTCSTPPTTRVNVSQPSPKTIPARPKAKTQKRVVKQKRKHTKRPVTKVKKPKREHVCLTMKDGTKRFWWKGGFGRERGCYPARVGQGSG